MGKTMRCPVCHRRLRSPESVAKGIGPVCYERRYGKKHRKAAAVPEPDPEDNQIPGQMSIEDFLETGNAE